MRAKELMTTPAYTCGVHDTAEIAAQVMWERDCDALPVIDTDGHVAGVVSDRDICLAAYFQRAPLSAIGIENVMSSNVCTCRPDDDVSEVKRRMGDRQMRSLPVVDASGLPVGILSIENVAVGSRRHGE